MVETQTIISFVLAKIKTKMMVNLAKLATNRPIHPQLLLGYPAEDHARAAVGMKRLEGGVGHGAETSIPRAAQCPAHGGAGQPFSEGLETFASCSANGTAAGSDIGV